MIDKIKWYIGLPFSIVGVLVHMVCLPFAGIAKLLGHNYWQISNK